MNTLHVGGDANVTYYLRWSVDDACYLDRSPCLVIPLRSNQDTFLLQGQGGSCHFDKTIMHALTFLPSSVTSGQSVRVRATDLDDLLREPRLLSKVDLSECLVEVDIVEPEWEPFYCCKTKITARRLANIYPVLSTCLSSLRYAEPIKSECI